MLVFFGIYISFLLYQFYECPCTLLHLLNKTQFYYKDIWAEHKKIALLLLRSSSVNRKYFQKLGQIRFRTTRLRQDWSSILNSIFYLQIKVKFYCSVCHVSDFLIHCLFKDFRNSFFSSYTCTLLLKILQ